MSLFNYPIGWFTLTPPELLCCILNQFLEYNKYVRINKKRSSHYTKDQSSFNIKYRKQAYISNIFRKIFPKQTYQMGQNIFATTQSHTTHICYALNIKFEIIYYI